MRCILCKRLLLAIVAFAAAYLFLTDSVGLQILEWIIRRGRAAGCQVFEAGVRAVGVNGPFFGEGVKVRLFNLLATHGVWGGGAMAGLLVAIGVYSICRALERHRPLGYRGPTRCGGCGYGLTGLREPRCPECGLAI